MKAFTTIFLASLIISVSIISLPTLAYDEPSAGVKEGNWIEYDVNITGTPPPVHKGVDWMRIEVLHVESTAFPVNLSVRFANGTTGSSIWRFNFTEGNTEGWIVIPSSLGPGETFYDNFSKADKHIVIQSQEQQTVLGASRTLTFGNDSYRHKQWDKATGVFVRSSESFRNWSAYVNIVATNLWSPQILGLNQTVLYALVAISIVLTVLILSSLIIDERRKRTKKLNLHYPLQGKTTALGVLIILFLAVGAIIIISFFWSEIGLSAAKINLFMQTFWTSLVLVSMWFRKKGNYLVHGIIMVVVVGATLVSFSAVLFMSPPSDSSMNTYFSSPLKFAEFISHAILSIPAIIFGVWLVALWRPRSTSFAAKSKRIAQITAILWVLSYVVGVLGFVADYTTFFG